MRAMQRWPRQAYQTVQVTSQSTKTKITTEQPSRFKENMLGERIFWEEGETMCWGEEEGFGRLCCYVF